MLICLAGRSRTPQGKVGSIGSGKTTVANLLQREGYLQIALADPMKRFAKDLFGFNEDQLWGDSNYRNAPDGRYPKNVCDYISARDVLLSLGSWGRNFYDGTWYKALTRTILELQANKYADYSPVVGVYQRPGIRECLAGIVVTDVRHRDELNALKQLGAKCILVERSIDELIGDAYSHEISERDLLSCGYSEWDFVINNVGDLKHLEQEVEKTLSLLEYRNG